tara:strand:+ start:7062 stop:7331 length:270 start_codon:yes stop_codon:yes gene_type:complete
MDNTTLETAQKIKKEMRESSNLIDHYKDCVAKMKQNIEKEVVPSTRVNGIEKWEHYLPIKAIYVEIMLNLQLAEENEKLRVLTAQFKNL